MKRICMLATVGLVASLAAASPAPAAFPGHNGKIAYSELVDSDPNDGVISGQSDIFTINPDGSGLTNLTNSPESEVNPAWSADGRKLVLTISRVGGGDIYTMD